MELKICPLFNLLWTSFVICLYLFISQLPCGEGQYMDYRYESPNNQCGGRFRSARGSLNFTFNEMTNPDRDSKKVCMWTIIPNPFQTHIKFRLVSTKNLSCPSNDALGFTSFSESSTEIESYRACSPGDVFTLKGSVVVVSLISKNPVDGTGFYLTWENGTTTTLYSRIRFVNVYYSYGRHSSRPSPYFAGHFMGNSLSTYAFPIGNRTAGYRLQMQFKQIKLQGNPESCPMPRPGPGEFPLCNALLICKLEDTGVLSPFQMYNSTVHKNLPEFSSNNGIFFIMWGGNIYNATGGGTMSLTFASVRNNRLSTHTG